MHKDIHFMALLKKRKIWFVTYNIIKIIIIIKKI